MLKKSPKLNVLLTDHEVNELYEVAAKCRDDARWALIDMIGAKNPDVKPIHLAAAKLYASRSNLIGKLLRQMGCHGVFPDCEVVGTHLIDKP